METNTWFTTNGMGCVIGVYSLGPPSLGENSFSSCSFHNGNQYLVYNKGDEGGVSKWKHERFGNFLE